MDTSRFDALTRSIALTRSRRELLKTVGGGALAAIGGIFGATRAGGAASCPSGVVCAAQCCPNATDVCLAGRCASCPSGIVCAAQCCEAGEQCVFGQCRPTSSRGSPGPNPGPCQPATACPAGQTCGTSDDGCGGTLTCGACDAPYVCNTYDNPPPNCVCEDFQTVCDGKCGQFNDSCGNPVDCGGCDSGCCHSDNTCHPPDCSGKVCGDDGCGGSCGTCGPGESCENGDCVCTNTQGICHTPSGDVCSANNGCYGPQGWCPSGYIDSSGACCCLNVGHPFDGDQCHMYPDSGCCLEDGASCDYTTAGDCCSGQCIEFQCYSG